MKDRACAGHCPREIDQRALDFGSGTQDLRQQCSRPAADINHRLDLLPASCDEDLRVWSAVTWRPRQRIKARRDVRMRFEILPERQAENLVVGRSACSDGGKEAAPGIGHATTDAIQVKAELLRWVEQLLGRFIEREPTGRRLLKDTFAHQMPEHLLQGVGITPCFLGKRFNVSGVGGHVVGDPQGCHHVDAPVVLQKLEWNGKERRVTRVAQLRRPLQTGWPRT
jgi:hypothetical protein